MPPPHQSLRFNSGKFFLAGLCYCVIKNRSGNGAAFSHTSERGALQGIFSPRQRRLGVVKELAQEALTLRRYYAPPSLRITWSTGVVASMVSSKKRVKAVKIISIFWLMGIRFTISSCVGAVESVLESSA